MAKEIKTNTKQGSVMEGIFAMYCAAYLVDPNDGKNKSEVKDFINNLAINTMLKELKTKGKFAVTYDNTFPAKQRFSEKHFKDVSIVKGTEAKKKVPITQKNATAIKELNPSKDYFDTVGVKGFIDFSRVTLKVGVKEAETGDFYGENLKKIIAEEKKRGGVRGPTGEIYKSLKQRMETLINAKSSTFFRDLTRAKKAYLKNSRTDVVEWTVDADGIGGESSKGAIKQDVTIKIMANGKKILERELNFSLKASSTTVHGGGTFASLRYVYDLFGPLLKSSVRSQVKKLMISIEDKATDEAPDIVAGSLWCLLGKELPKSGSKMDSQTSEFFKVLETKMFGTQYQGSIQVLDMQNQFIKETTKANFLRLARDSGVKLYPVWRPTPNSSAPGNIVILPVYANGVRETNIKKAVFHFRPRYAKRKDPSTGARTLNYTERKNLNFDKILVEIPNKKSIVYDYNYPDFAKKGLLNDVELRDVKDYKPL
tara:strand:- start:463 stop:1911 length:1449 start_codon:yes stop_codon:yes gene_type:complete